jgi:methylated-DNA-protein-cysteine methyltransferase-like protein
LYSDFTQDVIKIIKSIPSGKVLTYGLVAKMAGNPRGARQVSRILHSLTRKFDLPWHRIINSKGVISVKFEGRDQQRMLLEREGVEFSTNQKIDLKKYIWKILDLEDSVNKNKEFELILKKMLIQEKTPNLLNTKKSANDLIAEGRKR